MVAPAPEVPFAGVTRRPAAETVPDVRTRAPRSYALGAIGGFVLVVIVIGGVVWLMKRHNKTVAASNPQPVTSTAAAANKNAPSAAGRFHRKDQWRRDPDGFDPRRHVPDGLAIIGKRP